MHESKQSSRIEDAPLQSWVLRLSPAWSHPWLQLVRADRPIGSWLLLIPCWQGIALAASVEGWNASKLWLFAAFALGAVVMRGAGCALNDIADRDIDRRVQRTRNRPVASGAITRMGAAVFAGILSLAGLSVLLSMNNFAIGLGLLAIIPAALYPFSKRFTHWPQLVLGIAFNWGALLGWAAYTGYLGWAPLLLYASGICWTLGYDTIYALMDRDDDREIGVKSLAIKFGDTSPRAIAGFYVAAVAFAAAAGYAAGLGLAFWLVLAAFADRLAWQCFSLQTGDRQNCLRMFRANRDAGLVLLAAILVGSL